MQGGLCHGNQDCKSVERQAKHQPNRLNKPRTGSVGTDRLGRVRKPVRKSVRRKGRIGAEIGRLSDCWETCPSGWKMQRTG